MKKLLIVNGAGGSLDFGMPSVKEIDKLFEEWAVTNVPLSDDCSKSLYSWVKERLRDYSSNNKSNRMMAIMNFENLLYTLQAIAEVERDKKWQRFNNRLNPFINLDILPEIQVFGQKKIADGDDFSMLQSFLIDRLLSEMRAKCKTLQVDKKNEILKLRSFLSCLKDEFDLGIFNLNYDNVILSAMPNLKTGFNLSTGEFERRELYDSKWNFCYHLHGSVHFDMQGGKNTEMHKIFWNRDLDSKFKSNSSGRGGNFTSEGLMHLNSNIIAGLDKANQLLREPFAQYFMQLDRAIFEADAILFMGYGFNDWHLNKLFPFIRYDKSKIRKVVVLDWASDKEDGLSHRHDDWSFGLFGTIPYNGNEMGNGKNKLPEPAAYFIKRKKFERSSNMGYPLAVWYNGLLPACDDPGLFITELV